MGYKLNEKSMKSQLISFLIKIILGGLGILTFWFIMTIVLINIGLVVPSNYAESIINNNKHLLEEKIVNSEDLPLGSEFAVFDNELNYLYGNMDNVDIQISENVVSGDKNVKRGSFAYGVYNRTNDILVIKYSIKPYINLEFGFIKNPNYNLVSLFSLLIIYIGYIYYLISRLIKEWANEFLKISNIVNEIQEQNLDFHFESSKIKEFNATINSIIIMRDALQMALYKQWEIENNKIKEITALAHDIKIPLTIIKGNAQLNLIHNNEFKNEKYINNVIDASEKMEQYISVLIQYAKVNDIDFMKQEYIECAEFVNRIINDINVFTESYEKNVIFNKYKTTGKLYVDYFSIERAILNIINNAIEYGVDGRNIIFDINQIEEYLHFDIINEGDSFDEEVITKGKNLFYTSDKSRGSTHHGIGLAYSDKVIKAHNGKLILRNDENKGTVVEIILKCY